MAFLSTTALVQRCVIRLRQVPGVATQSYAEGNIALLLEEVYEQARALRWWDHLTTFQLRTLDGTTGKVTAPFVGARERMRDVQGVFGQDQSTALPMLQQHTNPSRYTGSRARAVEALSVSDDPAGTLLFRVYPLAAIDNVYVRLRGDPPNLFVDPAVVVPFDASVLVNGACMKYAIMDGTNSGSVAEFDRAFEERVKALLQQHDSTPIKMDSRNRYQTDWIEEYR